MCQHASTEQSTQAEQTLFVEGRTSIRVAPITSFDAHLETAGKVSNLTESSTAELLLDLSAAIGQVASAYKTAESERFLSGVAKALNSVLQVAAVEGIPASLLLEAARANLERDAQQAAIAGVVEFFKERGLN